MYNGWMEDLWFKHKQHMYNTRTMYISLLRSKCSWRVQGYPQKELTTWFIYKQIPYNRL